MWPSGNKKVLVHLRITNSHFYVSFHCRYDVAWLPCCHAIPSDLFSCRNFIFRRRLGGYHAKTPLRCLFLSIGVSILCLSIVNSLVQYSLSILIWILFISLSFAVFNSSPYSHPNCPLTPDELAVSWIKAKHILIWNLLLILLLQIFFAHSNCSLYCEMGIIAAAISFFVSKFKEVKSS